MSHVGVRTAVVVGAAAALWLLAGAARAEEMEIELRLPYVPAEVLPPVPSDPSSPVSLRIDPGDNDDPDPAPRVALIVRS